MENFIISAFVHLRIFSSALNEKYKYHDEMLSKYFKTLFCKTFLFYILLKINFVPNNRHSWNDKFRPFETTWINLKSNDDSRSSYKPD